MPELTWRVAEERNHFDLSRDLWIVAQGRDGPSAVEFVYHPFREHMLPTIKHTARLDERSHRNLMQAMLDAAWGMGLRPAGFADTEGTLAATRAHLDDMRLLAGVPAKRQALDRLEDMAQAMTKGVKVKSADDWKDT